MYQPNISKSPLLATGIIERDYASGLPEAQAPETIAPEPSPAPSPKKSFVPNAKPKNVNASQNDTQSDGPEKPSNEFESEPVEKFEFQDAQAHLNDEVIDSENVEVEVPDDVAKETAKQLTILLDLGCAMMCERKVVVDMNSIKMAILKGKMHPIYEETFEKVNEANREAAHISKDNQKIVQASLTTIIKHQKIQAINPTTAAFANLGLVAISQIATVKSTIASNENMIATAIEKTREVSDVTPKAEPVQETKSNKTKKF